MTAGQEVAGAEEFDGVPVVLYEDSRAYESLTSSVPLARQRAGRLVGGWGHPELVWSTQLLVSELATNALLHGCLRGRLFQVRIVLRRTSCGSRSATRARSGCRWRGWPGRASVSGGGC
ncbi:hypothetical protein ACIOEX_04615 [Streptomyces sp. NPDC087850]|uniref:hypothetical protein n=1 Tax=Streptomyces sp. NPDC087850 TaxID=3365809 RepID=UPI00381FF286